MDYKKIVASAISDAEKTKQEQEIAHIKSIVKAYLEKIFKKEEEKKELEKAIKALKADLEDLKLGRLDKIEEKQGKDKEHDNNTLIIIHKIEKEYIPYQPWRSPWIIAWNYKVSYDTSSDWTLNYANTATVNANDSTMLTSRRLLGTSFQNFSGGTYDIFGQIINL